MSSFLSNVGLDIIPKTVGKGLRPLTKATGIVTSKILANTAQDLANTVNRHGGLARTNRFSVFLKTPNYNLFNQNALSVAYGLSNGYIESFLDDVRDVGVFCETVTIPNSIINTFDYSTVGHTQKMVKGFANTEFTMTFTVTNDYFIPRMFKTWEKSIINRRTNRIQYKDSYTRDIHIICCDDNNIPNYIVRIINAFPINQSEMRYNENEMNANQKYTITFSYEDFEEYSLNDMFGDVSSSVDKALKTFESIVPDIDGFRVEDLAKKDTFSTLYKTASGAVSDGYDWAIKESNFNENYQNSFVKKVVGSF